MIKDMTKKREIGKEREPDFLENQARLLWFC